MRLVFVIVFLFVLGASLESHSEEKAQSLSEQARFFEKFLPAGRIVSAELKGDKLIYASAGSSEPHKTNPSSKRDK